MKTQLDRKVGAVKPDSSQSGWLRCACLSALLVAIIFSAFVRVRWRNMPLERDEGEFAYVGQLMLQGIPPYKIASNMKLPGIYAAYAGIMAVFGETASGIRTGLIVVNIAATILVFLLAKHLYGWLAGTVAGMTYSFLSCRPAVLGFYAHATHFVVLAALAGILLLLYALESERSSLYFGSGLCLGLAFLMKQPGILFAVFAGSYWLWREWRLPFTSRRVAVRGAALFAGLALPFATDVSDTSPRGSVFQLLVLDLVLRTGIWLHNDPAGRAQRAARFLAVGDQAIRDLGDRCSGPSRSYL